MVTVSKSPSQMSGGWLSGRFGGRCGGSGSFFLMCGVVGSVSAVVVVVVVSGRGGDAALGLGFG